MSLGTRLQVMMLRWTSICIIFCGLSTVRKVTIVTTTSLPNPNREQNVTHAKHIHLSVPELVCSFVMGPNHYILQDFQALVHSQCISQCSGSRISNPIPFKTVEKDTSELVQMR